MKKWIIGLVLVIIGVISLSWIIIKDGINYIEMTIDDDIIITETNNYTDDFEIDVVLTIENRNIHHTIYT